MKVKWSVEDIKPGRVVSTIKTTEQWMIGYVVRDTNIWCLISLSDGMVDTIGDKATLTERLTDGEYLPIEIMGRPTIGK